MMSTEGCTKMLGLLLATASAAAIGCGSGDPGSNGEDEVGSSASAIVNGWDMTADQVHVWSLIGVYHRDGSAANAPWFPRPCSGVVAKIANGYTYVLTARHCVTTNHTVSGPVFPGTALQVWSAPHLPLGAPPLEAIASSSIIPMPNPAGDSDYARDFAVVVVPASADFLPLVASRKGLFVGDPSQLNGHEYTAFGYGVSDPTNDCAFAPYPSIGAGIARLAGPFVALNGVSSPPGGLYNFVNGVAGPNGTQWLNCGDSGGPDIMPYGPDDSPADQIIGVHSTGMAPGSTKQSAVVTPWVQEQLGGVYLYNDFLGQVLKEYIGSLNFTPPGSSNATPVFYYASTGQLKLNSSSNSCLGLTSGRPRFKACVSSDVTQRWTVSWNRTIRSNTNNQCLKALSGTNVVLQACSFGIEPRQLWQFSAHNG